MYTFSDAGRGAYLAILQQAAASDGARLDEALGRDVARELIARYFPALATGGAGDGSSAETFDPNRYQGSGAGLALLPYGGSDLELSVDAALVAPGRFGIGGLRDAFVAVTDDPDQTRERQLIALAGRAAIGDDVLSDVRSAAQLGDLTTTEELYVGLAAASLGDSATALRMERAVLGQAGQRQGPWVRVESGSGTDDVTDATARLAMLAAEVGDPIASSAEAYVAAHPATEFGDHAHGARVRQGGPRPYVAGIGPVRLHGRRCPDGGRSGPRPGIADRAHERPRLPA